MDASGRMLVSQYDTHCLRMISAEGVVTIVAGVCGAAGSVPTQAQESISAPAARFVYPAGVAVDPTDNSFVIADGNNHMVRRLLQNSTGWFVINVAGTGAAGTAVEWGIAKSQPLTFPRAVVVSPAGVIFVHTYGAPVNIWSIRRDGYISLVALSGVAGNPLSDTSALLGQTGNDVLGLALAPNGDLYMSAWKQPTKSREQGRG